MAKKGMKRSEYTHTQPKNNVSTVSEIQGKAKSGKIHANPVIAGTSGVSQKVWHNKSVTIWRTIFLPQICRIYKNLF